MQHAATRNGTCGKAEKSQGVPQNGELGGETPRTTGTGWRKTREDNGRGLQGCAYIVLELNAGRSEYVLSLLCENGTRTQKRFVSTAGVTRLSCAEVVDDKPMASSFLARLPSSPKWLGIH